MSPFILNSPFAAKGDQPEAIDTLTEHIRSGVNHQILLGVTGSGKTFTMANVIERIDLPTLVIVHNKTLAAQLYNEFRDFFPENAVEYFVSYYDYYQPEAYLPQTDTYIEKDSSINDEIDKMRHSATMSVLTRRDVIVVASVSCIYGLGSPETYQDMHVSLSTGEVIDRDTLLEKLVKIHYSRNDIAFERGHFRVRGDTVEIHPSNEQKRAFRIEFFGDEIEYISLIDSLSGLQIQQLDTAYIYPNSHFVTSEERLNGALKTIGDELEEQMGYFSRQKKLLELQRIETRTRFDMEMMREIGYCKGVENYSRHLDGRREGEPPHTLIDYFPDDSLIIIDESHVTIPQIRGMYEGDRSRKMSLVEHGFRLPSALDNRPLNFKEFEEKAKNVIYVSATPGPYERQRSGQIIVEQLIRPTGLMDPKIKVKPVKGQVDDLIGEIRARVHNNQRVLVTTLTKRFAEDLTEYLQGAGLRVRYLHSDIDTLDRVNILRELRLGEFDTLVGVNLLREGLDLPEVSLVAILDADKEGFLRSETSLIQTCGRAARNVDGTVIMYADTITGSMKRAIEETNRRRKIQEEFNRTHNITPESIKKSIHEIMGSVYEADYYTVAAVQEDRDLYLSEDELEKTIAELEKDMREAAAQLEFEKAAELRDRIHALKERNMGIMSGKKE